MSEQLPSRNENHEQERTPPPRIYVASLSDYNNGWLHGEWIDADQAPGALLEAISEMLARSRTPGAEEWAVHDYEGFGQVALSEYESIETISRLAQGIAEHGEAFAAWASVAGTAEEELERFEDSYLGEWESLADYAESFIDDLGLDQQLERVVPASLAPYVSVDYEALGRDLELGGDIISVDKREGSGVFLFQP
jgi:antirestriction protein